MAMSITLVTCVMRVKQSYGTGLQQGSMNTNTRLSLQHKGLPTIWVFLNHSSLGEKQMRTSQMQPSLCIHTTHAVSMHVPLPRPCSPQRRRHTGEAATLPSNSLCWVLMTSPGALSHPHCPQRQHPLICRERNPSATLIEPLRGPVASQQAWVKQLFSRVLTFRLNMH